MFFHYIVIIIIIVIIVIVIVIKWNLCQLSRLQLLTVM